jgi:hypothetical protein
MALFLFNVSAVLGAAIVFGYCLGKGDWWARSRKRREQERLVRNVPKGW